MEVNPMPLRPKQGRLVADLLWDSAGTRARDGRKHRRKPGEASMVRVAKRRDRRQARQEIYAQLRDSEEEIAALREELAAAYAEAIEWQAKYEEEYFRIYDRERQQTTVHSTNELMDDDWWYD